MKGTTKYGPGGGCRPTLLEDTGLSIRRRESLSKYINQGLSQKTWDSYQTAERMWRRCEKETGEKMDLPWRQKDTLLFTDWLLSDRKVSSATAGCYLAGIRKLHEMRGIENPGIRKSLVNQVLKGKRNEEAVTKRCADHKGRLPVTLTVMKLMKEVIRGWSQPMEWKLLMWAVCTLAFHGSFRIHELLCQHETYFDPDFTLLEKDVQMQSQKLPGGKEARVLIVTVKAPKENKKGGVAVVDVYETGGPTCPVKAFCQWKNKRQEDGNKILFRSNDGVPLTGRRFNVLLKHLLEPHIDYSKGSITAHSFRSGIPSLLGALGHTDEEIKKIGRWSSRSFEHYTKLPRTTRAAIAQKLGKL